MKTSPLSWTETADRRQNCCYLAVDHWTGDNRLVTTSVVVAVDRDHTWQLVDSSGPDLSKTDIRELLEDLSRWSRGDGSAFKDGLTITAENDPDSRVHCSRCGEHIRAPKAKQDLCAACTAKGNP